jgi:hypothetical protein
MRADAVQEFMRAGRPAQSIAIVCSAGNGGKREKLIGSDTRGRGAMALNGAMANGGGRRAGEGDDQG